MARGKSKKSNGALPAHEVGASFQLTEKQAETLTSLRQDVSTLVIQLGNLVDAFETEKASLLEQITGTKKKLETATKRYAKGKKVDVNAPNQAWTVELPAGVLKRVR